MPKVQTTIIYKKIQQAKDEGYTTASAQGSSRCFAAGTLVRMHDGTLKKVEDIVVGDKVMSATGDGYNSVIETHNGTDKLYKVHQHRGIDYIVNSKHILSLKQTRAIERKVAIEGYKSSEKRKVVMMPYDKDVVHNFDVIEYLSLSKNKQKLYTGFKNTLLQFEERELPIEPYYLGVWLGDGTSCRYNEITNTDVEIIEWFKNYSNQIGSHYVRIDDVSFRFKASTKDNNCPISEKVGRIKSAFHGLCLLNNKHVPEVYLHNSYENRLKLLAGLLDTDGTRTSRNTIVICQKRECIIDAIVELCNTCGFYTSGKRTRLSKMKRDDGTIYECVTYDVEINHNDFNDLNRYMKVERKKVHKNCDRNYFASGIEIECVGTGEYYGFTLDNSPYFLLKDGTIVHNSSKTYNIVLWLIIYCINHANTSASIVRQTLPSLKRSVFRDFKENMINLGVWHDREYNKSEMIYSFPNGSFIEFFSADNEQKLRGSKRNILYVNEGNELLFIEWQQLQMRTTDFSIIDYNPSFSDDHWICDLNKEERTFHFISTYKDNPFLEQKVINEIESLKYKNESLWRVYGLGLQAIIEGLIFTNVEIVDEVPKWCKKKGWLGVDYGYTHDPTAITKVYVHNDTIYVEEVCYATQMLTEDIIRKFKEVIREDHRNYKIISESADPRLIDEIHNAELDIHPVRKYGGSIMAGITKMLEYKICVTKSSENVIREFKNYTYRQDKEGRWLNEPIDCYNHAIDSIRYVCLEEIMADNGMSLDADDLIDMI